MILVFDIFQKACFIQEANPAAKLNMFQWKNVFFFLREILVIKHSTKLTQFKRTDQLLVYIMTSMPLK